MLASCVQGVLGTGEQGSMFYFPAYGLLSLLPQHRLLLPHPELLSHRCGLLHRSVASSGATTLAPGAAAHLPTPSYATAYVSKERK